MTEMNVPVISTYNPNILSVPYEITAGLARAGARAHLLSVVPPDAGMTGHVDWIQIPRAKGIRARVPWFRSNGDRIIGILRSMRPDYIVAQHEYVIPALVYGAIYGVEVMAYFADHQSDRRFVKFLRHFAGRLDAYVDCSSTTLGLRQQQWPRLKCRTFVLHSTAKRTEGEVEPHDGPARVVFAGSAPYTLGLNPARLSRFIERLCQGGVSVDWYLPGPAQVRETARSLLRHPLYSVRDPLPKTELMQALRHYDVGLHWAPMADQHFDPVYFRTAASNKIGEYAASGLIVAHAGNPGLAFLPADAAAVFDPTDPIAGAEQLAAALSDRQEVERKRRAALRYHQVEFNLEAQSAPVIRYIMERSRGGQASYP